MGGKRAKRFRATAKRSHRSPRSARARRIALFAAPVVLIAAIAAGYFAFFGDTPTKPGLASHVMPPKVVRSAKTLEDLLKIPADKLGDVDIAEMNLLCAAGLPGAEKLDVDHALATLDLWAELVKSVTERHLYRVTAPGYAEHYRHSEAYLRAEMLVQALCEDLGVKYDPSAKAGTFSFKDSRVAFIHGMIPAVGQSLADTPGGTCASMPVMYVAIGRRLGYPLKLVTTKGHVFVRWDGKDHPNPAWRERFNMEGTHGFSSHPDEYYKTWPFKLTDQQVKANGHLVSLTPRQEFAEFLAARGHCGADNGQLAFAARCYENAHGYDPDCPAYRLWFGDAALASGYRSKIPALASLVARRMRRKTTRDPDLDGMQRPSDLAAAAAASGMTGISPMNLGRWQPDPTTYGAPLPPTYRPGQPQDGTPQPGVTNPYQPYQPPTPGQPPR